MKESVIFNSPLLLIGYGIALLFCVFDLKKHASGMLFPALSVIIFSIVTVTGLLMGADMRETALMILLFLACNLTVYGRGGGQQ